MARRPRRRNKSHLELLDLVHLHLLFRSRCWEVGEDLGLTPVQVMLLTYLAHANEFSRSPAAMAEFSGSTRGTISQTLKLLEAKGLVERSRDPYDARSLRVQLSARGRKLVRGRNGTEDLMLRFERNMEPDTREALRVGLESALRAMVGQWHHVAFGTCTHCIHLEPAPRGGRCSLLEVPRPTRSLNQICQYAETEP